MFDMNSRARILTLAALVCAAAVTVTACAHSQQAAPADSASPRPYGGGHMRHRGGHGDSMMMRGLDLTKDQQAQIALIRDRYKLQADSLRLGGGGRDSASREAFHSLMMKQMSEVRAVLTPDQQKKFDDRMSKMRERRRMHERDGAPRDSTTAPPA